MKFGVLKVITADGRSRDYPIDLPSLVIGRADGNNIVIDDLSIARRHARLTIDSGRLLIEDLGSASGTFIAGHRIPPNSPSLVENAQDIRFGDIEVRYEAAPASQAEQPPQGEAVPDEEIELPPTIRASLTVPSTPLELGAAPTIAYLAVQNRGRVVDELSITVLDLPPEWVRVSQPKLVLLPGAQAEVTIIIQPPRVYVSHAGDYDFSVVVSSGESGREVLTNGRLTVLPFEATNLTLHPVRSKRDFKLVAENQGNAFTTYTLAGRDDEEAFSYRFEAATFSLPPGGETTIPFQVLAKKRKLFGQPLNLPFSIVATPADGGGMTRSSVGGQFAMRPPLQKFVKPLMFTLLALAILAGALAYFFWPSSSNVQKASAEAAYAGVHMCDKNKPTSEEVAANRPKSTSSAPMFKQNDPKWADVEYAKAGDPEFGPDWCGTTIEQCGCAMTSVASVMAVFEMLTMPDGSDLSPQTLNAWFNLDARKTARGWVSRGYVYGDVIWTAVNELSGEMAKTNPNSRKIRFLRTGSGSEAEIRTELKANRPIILEVPGHWIAAIGMDGDKILINDPYYKDRTTLDAYAGKVKSSVLFEPSEDLSAVVVTAPSNVRLRVTDAQGRVVGTLNTGTAEEAKKDVQTGIPGSSYSTRDAWRDPTCVESPPPPGAGTTQILLPGAPGQYKVEAVDVNGGPTSVAIHTYDRSGVLHLDEKDNDGPTVLSLDYDPAKGAQVSVVPGAVPGGGNTALPSPAGTTPPGATVAKPSPSPSGSATAGASATNGAGSPTASPTATPTPVPPPANVAVTCNTAFSAPPAAKSATLSCTTNIDGAFTSVSWSLNGVNVPAFNGKTAFTTAFSSDTTAAVQVTACNANACKSGSSTATVKFPPPGATAAPTTASPGGGGTPTPAPPPSGQTLVCNAAGTQLQKTVSCSTSFDGQYSSIAWSAPGVNPPDASAGTKSFSFTAILNDGGGSASVTIGSQTSASFGVGDSAGAINGALAATFGGGAVTATSAWANNSSLTIVFTVSASVCNYSSCASTGNVTVQISFPKPPTPTPTSTPTPYYSD